MLNAMQNANAKCTKCKLFDVTPAPRFLFWRRPTNSAFKNSSCQGLTMRNPCDKNVSELLRDTQIQSSLPKYWVMWTACSRSHLIIPQFIANNKKPWLVNNKRAASNNNHLDLGLLAPRDHAQPFTNGFVAKPQLFPQLTHKPGLTLRLASQRDSAQQLHKNKFLEDSLRGVFKTLILITSAYLGTAAPQGSEEGVHQSQHRESSPTCMS